MRSFVLVALAAAQQPMHWVDVVKGVAQGFGLRGTEQELEGCFKSSEGEYDNIRGAVALFEKKDAKDVIDGLADLGKAFDVLPSTINTCETASKELKEDGEKLAKALDTLKHPLSFIYHVGKDLVVNGKDIFEEVTAAKKNYKTQQWQAFGQDVGEALEKLLVGTPTMKLAAEPEPQWEEWADVVRGVALGFGVNGTDELVFCVRVAKLCVYKDVCDAVDLFEKKDAKDVIDGLTKLGEALESVPITFVMCKEGSEKLKEEGKKLAKALETLKHPSAFIYHVGEDLIVNGKDIYEDIAAALHDYKNKDWKAFGQDLGRALQKILVGDSMTLLV